MMTTESIKTYLYWFLVLEVCLISISIAAASMLLALVIVALLIILSKERKWTSAGKWIDYAFLAYCAIEFITAFNSNQPFDALKNSKRLLLIALVYGVIISFTTKERIRKAVMLLSGSVALLSVAEIIFYFYEGIARLYVFQHYMTTGGLKMIISLLLIPFILSPDTSKRERIYSFIVLIPTLTALILTNTRSAWLGLVVGVIVISMLYYKRLFLILAAVIVLFLTFGPQQQVDRAKSIIDFTNSTNIGRLNMWSTGLQMWQDRPTLGFGDIDLYHTYLTYRTPTGDEPAGHLHNIYVHLLVTIGAAGLLVVLTMFSVILQNEYEVVKQYSHDAFIRNIALGSIAVFTGFMVNGIFEWNFGDHEIMVFVWFTVGLCIAARNSGTAEV
ncbi:MAG: O-antigen ligase family protein [Bacteroidota bacterium]